MRCASFFADELVTLELGKLWVRSARLDQGHVTPVATIATLDPHTDANPPVGAEDAVRISVARSMELHHVADRGLAAGAAPGCCIDSQLTVSVVGVVTAGLGHGRPSGLLGLSAKSARGPRRMRAGRSPAGPARISA